MISLAEGDVVVVKINGQTASKRTRNRVKENGPKFEFVKIALTHQTLALQGGRAVFLKSRTTNWIGWLPEREIVVSRSVTTT